MASIEVEAKKDGTRRYVVRYRTPEGGSRKRRFDRKVDASRFLTEVEHSKNVDSYIDAAAGRTTFGQFAAEWLDAQTFDESTREAVSTRLRRHILPTFGPLRLRSIRPSTVQTWLRALQQECAPRYVRVMLANVSAIFAAAVEDGYLVRNPCSARSVRPPALEQRRVTPWTADQVQRVIEEHPARYRAIPVVASGAGLRQGEAFGLRVSDVDFLRREIHIRQQVKIVNARVVLAPPKGRKTRTVPLADTVANELAEHIRRHPPGPDGLLFTTREAKPIARTYYNPAIWKPALVRAGIEPHRHNGMHQLRHWYASVVLDGGQSIRTLADYLGHADPGFTLRTYTHLMPESAERSRRAIDEMLSGTPRVHSVSSIAGDRT